MKTKTFYILIGVIIVAFLAYNYWNEVKAFFSKKIGSTGTWSDDTDTGSTGTGTTALDYTKVLRVGVNGPEVQVLQTALNTYGANPPLVTDGIFGNKTETALMQETGFKQITLNQFRAEQLKNKPWIPITF